MLQRNYKILMRDDLPMREQRGELRRRGYEFRMSESAVPSFVDSMKIMQPTTAHCRNKTWCRRQSPLGASRRFDSINCLKANASS